MRTWIVSAMLALTSAAFAGGYLGVNIADNTDSTTKKGNGVKVTGVVEGSGAEKAGLLKNDLITSINGTSISQTDELISYLNNLEAGEKVSLKVLRGDTPLDMEVELGERSIFIHRSDPKKWVFYADHHRPWLGIEYEALNPELAEYFGVSGGILVKRVREESPAKTAGLQAGDVITHLGGQILEDTRSLHKALSEKAEGDLVSLVVNRKGKVLDVTATLAQPPEMDFNFRHFQGKAFDWDEGMLKPLENLPQHLEMVRPFMHQWDSSAVEDLKEELKKLREELDALKKQKD